jgi:hypothetical protein
MNSDKLLDEIWEAYQTTIDCLKIARRSVDKCEDHLLNRTNFVGLLPDAAGRLIESSRSGVDDYVILSLWAAFERTIHHYIQDECSKILDNNGTSFNKNIHSKIDQEVEYWGIDDTLDIFKAIVGPELIGNAKQIKKYRDWIAHRNPKKGPPANVLPVRAYKVLSDILSCLEQHPDLLRQ